MRGPANVIVSWIAVVAAACIGSSAPAADAPAKAKSPPGYDSPEKVFQAYRAALRQHDFRTLYRCSTPEVKAGAVVEAFYACLMHSRAQVGGIQKKYCADEDTIEAKYLERYRKKFGRERARGVGFQNEADEELYWEVVLDSITDREGFYVAVNESLKKNQDSTSLENFRDVVIRKDTATARCETTIRTGEETDGNGIKTIRYQKFMLTIQFLKVDGGWLIDGHESEELE